jgi:hypothetical protein
MHTYLDAPLGDRTVIDLETARGSAGTSPTPAA